MPFLIFELIKCLFHWKWNLNISHNYFAWILQYRNQFQPKFNPYKNYTQRGSRKPQSAVTDKASPIQRNRQTEVLNFDNTWS